MTGTNNNYTTEQQEILLEGEEATGGWTERPLNIGTYPYVTAITTSSGHTTIKDDTPGSETTAEIHRTGTYTAVHPDGSMTTKIIGTNYQIYQQGNKVSITGDCDVTINGNCNMTVNGDKTEKITGDYFLEVQGDFKQLVNKTMSQTAKDMDISVGTTAGVLRIAAGSRLSLQGDLAVDGAITGISLTSQGQITAGTGIHAGVLTSGNPLAGISTLGGIYSGFPAASPTPGVIVATTSVSAPIIAGIQTFDMRGSMELIRAMFDMHIHPTPKGPSGPPIPLM